MMKDRKEILCDAFRPKGDIFMSSWYDRKAKEWEKVLCGEGAYDPDILLDCGDGSSVKVYTDEDGRMVFKPQKREE